MEVMLHSQPGLVRVDGPQIGCVFWTGTWSARVRGICRFRESVPAESKDSQTFARANLCLYRASRLLHRGVRGNCLGVRHGADDTARGRRMPFGSFSPKWWSGTESRAFSFIPHEAVRMRKRERGQPDTPQECLCHAAGAATSQGSLQL